MKRILYVITKSNWGGAQRYVYDLATNLPKNEFEVGVVLGGDLPDGKAGGLLAQKLQGSNTTIYRSASLRRDVSFGKDIKSFFELYSLFKKLRPDIVHLNSSKAGGVGALAARFAGIKKIIFTAHGWPFWEDRNTIVKAVIWLLSWLTALLSHTVIVISKYDLSVAHHMPFVHHKLVHIYNGIAPVELGSGEIIRSAFPPGVKITGTIGELNKNKSHIALIEQARQNPNMYVAIVGEGELHSCLQEKIAEYSLEGRVRLMGFIPYPKVLRGFDVFALPSIKEGLPYVLLQARFAGLPIEANRVGGVGEILDAKDMGEFTLKQMLKKTIALYRPTPDR